MATDRHLAADVSIADCRRRLVSGASVALALLSSVSSGPVLSGDVAAGRTAASQCNVCHGKDGLAVMPDAPNLAGESSIYIEKQLMAFKRGEREHRQMSIIAQGLDDDTIRDLAAWYDAMEVTVVVPE